jgi:F420-non-reducing hydrogenase small subunit
MSPNGKLQVGMYWAAGCGGCDISLLEIGERILDLLEIADIAFWPCIADFKVADVAAYPDRYIDLCFVNGAIRNSENEAIARLLRAKSATLVGYGSCAVDGGIPALANLSSPRQIFATIYHELPSTVNPGGAEPVPESKTAFGPLEIPHFHPAVRRLRDVVRVDYEIPGCPPQADEVWETIVALSSGAVPASNGAVRVGCTNRSVCDECKLPKRQQRIGAFRRLHTFRPEPGWCLLEQGVLCMGPATRGGCGALCPSAGTRCEGCGGPAAGVEDQGAAMAGALGSLLASITEDEAAALMAQVVDPVGTFYRFSMASSHLKLRRQPPA